MHPTGRGDSQCRCKGERRRRGSRILLARRRGSRILLAGWIPLQGSSDLRRWICISIAPPRLVRAWGRTSQSTSAPACSATADGETSPTHLFTLFSCCRLGRCLPRFICRIYRGRLDQRRPVKDGGAPGALARPQLPTQARSYWRRWLPRSILGCAKVASLSTAGHLREIRCPVSASRSSSVCFCGVPRVVNPCVDR